MSTAESSHGTRCPKYCSKVPMDDVDERLKEVALDVVKEMRFEMPEMEVVSDHARMFMEVDL